MEWVVEAVCVAEEWEAGGCGGGGMRGGGMGGGGMRGEEMSDNSRGSNYQKGASMTTMTKTSVKLKLAYKN
jgi:hypothetical protein